jgi:hypothetical protein
MIVAAVAGLALLAGCGGGVSGTYTARDGANKVTFKGNELTYTMDSFTRGPFKYKVKDKIYVDFTEYGHLKAFKLIDNNCLVVEDPTLVRYNSDIIDLGRLCKKWPKT